MSDDIYFGSGTTPAKVAEAVERAKEDRDRTRRPRSTRAERDAFFARIAEDIKRAEAG